MSAGKRPLFLTGFMGSGKSSVGRWLAARWGDGFHDIDTEVERRSGRTIGEIFARDGERRFRELEREALERLDGETGCVVATGGGLFAQREPRLWMKRRGLTLWLDVPLSEARRRVGGGGERPLWSELEPLELRELYERRRAVYALADLRVAAFPGGPEEVGRRALARIGPFFR